MSESTPTTSAAGTAGTAETTTTTTAPEPTQTPTESSPAPRKTILLINGPNLNLLGHREPHIYGHTTLSDIESHLGNLASSNGINILTYQSNHEGGIVDRVHEAFWANKKASSSSSEQNSTVEGTVNAIIINPGAYTHTSVAIRDALAGASIPFIECHISNVHAREAFRHKSFLSDKAEAVIAGLGVFGYTAALQYWIWKWKGAELEHAGK